MTLKSLALPAVLVATVTSQSFGAPLSGVQGRLTSAKADHSTATLRGGISGNLCDTDGTGYFITESTDVNVITSGGSIGCTGDGGTYGHSYGRYHNLSDSFPSAGEYEVQCVHWGFELNEIALPVIVNIYRDTDGIEAPGSGANDLVLLGSLGTDGSLVLPGSQSNPFYFTGSFSDPLTVNGSDLLFIELLVPSSSGEYLLGANSLGESSPGWIKTENGECGLGSWFTTTQIGYPDVHWVEALEIQPLIPSDPCDDPLPENCPADVTGQDEAPDGVINVSDLLAVIANWNTTGDGTVRPLGDCRPLPNGDCTVDVSDLLGVISEWGNTDCGPSDPTGACCTSDGTCVQDTAEADCGNGTWFEDTACSDITCGGPSDLTINELRTNQPSTDNDEYVEFHGIPGTSFDGYSFIVIGDGAAGDFGIIESAVLLTGNSIPADGIFLIAEATFSLGTPDAVTELNFENSSQNTYMLVQGFSGFVGDDLDTDDDGVLDSEPWQYVKDAVGFVGPDPAAGNPLYTNVTVGPDDIYVPAHAYRCPDGNGAWVVGCFELLADTPGEANDCAAGDSDDDGISDTCDNCPDLANPDQADCDGNGIGDVCEIADGTAQDCNGNGIPDNCENDCNGNGFADECDIDNGFSSDCDGNGIPDECQEDCDNNGQADACEILNNPALDENGNGVLDSCETPLFVINEVHADPSNGPDGSYADGDANGDGVGSYTDDEFVEIVNRSGDAIDMSGWILSDAVAERHVFPAGSIIEDQCVLVLFGGGTPMGDFGGAAIQTASSGYLGLNNSGDTITITDGAGVIQLELTYGSEGGDNQSITRSPDVYGDAFFKHSEVAPDGSLWSPGFTADGMPLGTCTAPVDSDGDGVPDEFDNCPDLPNTNQADCDDDGIGDTCEIADGTQEDVDGNGIPDDCEGDLPTDLWINEFHYDNASGDLNEFVEVVLLDGIDAAQVTLTLYNGSNGSTYGTYSVGTEFIPGESGSGWTVYSLAISGIQNGAPDGLCLDLGGQVAHFISYEGTLTATAGPASGLTSIDIGVAETSTTTENSSLGLTGAGGAAGDFAWTVLEDLASAGNLNDNQTLTP
jgi:hypothetical protein